MGREGVQDTRETRAVCINATAGGAESCAVGDRHGQTWRKGRGPGGRAKGVFPRSSTKVFVELSPEDYQAGDEHMCELLRYSLYGTRDAAQKWEGKLASTLSLKQTR